MKVAEWSALFYHRLAAEIPDLMASSLPDEYEHYGCTLPGRDLDLFVMGCDDCFASVWFEGNPVCDWSDAGAQDADEAARYIASILRGDKQP